VAIRRRLADPETGDPAAHEPDLAVALTAWAALLRGSQQDLDAALRASGEVVEIYRRLIAATPARFPAPLRGVLRLQADILVGLGRHQDARVVPDWLARNPGSPPSGA